MAFMPPPTTAAASVFVGLGAGAVQDLADRIMAGQPAGGVAGIPPTHPDISVHLPKWLRHAELAAAHRAPGDGWFRDAVKATITARTAGLEARQRVLDRAARNRLLAAALGADGSVPTDLKGLLSLGDEVKRAWRDTSGQVRKAIRARLDINASGREPPPTYAALTRFWRASGHSGDGADPLAWLNLAAAEFNELPADLRRRLLAAQNALAAEGL